MSKLNKITIQGFKSIQQLENLITPRKYHKRRDGIVIAQQVGLYAMRQQCRLFDAWIEQLECAEAYERANEC